MSLQAPKPARTVEQPPPKSGSGATASPGSQPNSARMPQRVNTCTCASHTRIRSANPPAPSGTASSFPITSARPPSGCTDLDLEDGLQGGCDRSGRSASTHLAPAPHHFLLISPDSYAALTCSYRPLRRGNRSRSHRDESAVEAPEPDQDRARRAGPDRVGSVGLQGQAPPQRMRGGACRVGHPHPLRAEDAGPHPRRSDPSDGLPGWGGGVGIPRSPPTGYSLPEPPKSYMSGLSYGLVNSGPNG